MSITVAKFKDVAEGTQPGQFTIGDHEAVSSLTDLDPSFKRLLVPDAAVAVQEADPAGTRAHVLGAQAGAFGEVSQCAVQDGDARAARGEGGRRALEDADLTAGVAEHQRRGQAADRPADDADGRHLGSDTGQG